MDPSTAYKDRYPFRLACPSYIYPAGYGDNVRRLCACVDEIELLLFESAPESLPQPAEIDELAALAKNGGIVFNIHLPSDVSIGDNSPKAETAVDSLLRAIDLSRPLAPVSYTLHVPFAESSENPEHIDAWRHRVKKNLKRLLSDSGLPAGVIAIETLDYPLDCLDGVIRDMNLSICLDTGHLMVRGYSCREVYDTYRERIVIIHAHGVNNGRDHLALDRLSEAQAEELGGILREFREQFIKIIQ